MTFHDIYIHIYAYQCVCVCVSVCVCVCVFMYVCICCMKKLMDQSKEPNPGETDPTPKPAAVFAPERAVNSTQVLTRHNLNLNISIQPSSVASEGGTMRDDCAKKLEKTENKLKILLEWGTPKTRMDDARMDGRRSPALPVAKAQRSEGLRQSSAK